MRAAIALGAFAVALGGCRAHMQDMVLDKAAEDFFAPKVLCSETFVGTPAASDTSSQSPVMQEVTLPAGDTATTRAQLTPWIVGPNQYVVEGCKHQARYVCNGVSCRREGPVEALRPFKRVTPTAAQLEAAAAQAAPGAPAPAGTLTPAAAQNDSAEESALRAALEARRSELASCVDHLPLGVKVQYAPGTAPVVTLRGELAGKPEEGCVRAVLKDLPTMSFKNAGVVIHVVK